LAVQVLMSKLITLKKKGGLFKFFENGIPVMLGLFIFIIPSPFNTSAQEILFYLSLAIAVFLITGKQTTFSFKSPFTTPFILFGLWVLICIPFALNKGNSLHDFYAHLLKHLFIFYLLINYFKWWNNLFLFSERNYATIPFWPSGSGRRYKSYWISGCARFVYNYRAFYRFGCFEEIIPMSIRNFGHIGNSAFRNERRVAWLGYSNNVSYYEI
jgi:hypothetical protein